MKDKKMIIRNCPAFMKPSYCKDKCSYSIANKRDGELTYKFEFDENSKCQDCADCVMKQIYEMCKSQKESSCTFAVAFLADRILQLLKVEECE